MMMEEPARHMMGGMMNSPMTQGAMMAATGFAAGRGLIGGVLLRSPLLLIGAYHAFGLLPRAQAWVLALPAPVRGVLYGLVIVALLMLVPVGPSTFIYRNF